MSDHWSRKTNGLPSIASLLITSYRSDLQCCIQHNSITNTHKILTNSQPKSRIYFVYAGSIKQFYGRDKRRKLEQVYETSETLPKTFKNLRKKI